MAIMPFNRAPVLLDEQEVLCRDCRLPVDILKKNTHITNKTSQEYQCGECNSKGECMARELGRWTTEEFKGLSAEDKIAFYRTESGISNLKQKYVNISFDVAQGAFENCTGALLLLTRYSGAI